MAFQTKKDAYKVSSQHTTCTPVKTVLQAQTKSCLTKSRNQDQAMTTFRDRILVINSCDFPCCSAKDEDWD